MKYGKRKGIKRHLQPRCSQRLYNSAQRQVSIRLRRSQKPLCIRSFPQFSGKLLRQMRRMKQCDREQFLLQCFIQITVSLPKKKMRKMLQGNGQILFLEICLSLSDLVAVCKAASGESEWVGGRWLRVLVFIWAQPIREVSGEK